MSKIKIKNSNQKIADILLKIGCVNINFKKKFTLTSGKKSPVYVDCRKIISFPKERKKLMKMALQILQNRASFNVIAGGETAGIPFAAWISELTSLPMIYIRKKSKGFGKNKRIEGDFKPSSNILLVEDLATDGSSKMSFVNAIRDAGGQCNTCFVIFHYNIFKQEIDKLKAQNVSIIELATWKNIIDVLYNRKIPENRITSIESFLKNPNEWKPE